MFCDDLEGGVGGGEGKWGGGDVSIIMADYHCCMTENNTL